MSELIGNRYRKLKNLGEGAMGEVCLVEDTTNGQQAALKLISGLLAGDEPALLKFKQEFRLMTQLDHPHCCSVFDYGVSADGTPYYSMEVVPGHGLDELLPLDGSAVLHVLSQLLLALSYIHQLGFVHRDIKSANVRQRPDGVVKLMDYGLMEYAGRSDAPISGTLAYIAPEVVKRATVDQRADLYSLGVLMYEMLTGHLPFMRESRVALLRAHVGDTPVPPSQLKPGLDPVLEAVTLKLLAKEPTDRYQSADEVLTALSLQGATGTGKSLLTPPLLGRDFETMRLYDFLGGMMGGDAGATVMLHGPTGIGKSRLVKEFRSAMQLEAFPFVSGTTREQGSTPYAPFREIIRGLIPSFQEHVPELLAQLAPVLLSLVPELDGAPGLGVVGPAPEMDSPSKEKVRLQASVAELFKALAARQCFIVLLEDWQWADALSLDMLDYVVRNTAGSPILTIVTSRGLPPGAAAWMASAVSIPLHQLPQGDVQRIVTAMLGTTDVDPPFLAQVAKASDGNPFYVERLLEHLVQQGMLRHENGHWNTAIALPTGGLPKDLQGLLMRKLAALTEDAITLARVGAVIGREFDLGLLQKLAGLGDERLFDALALLQKQQILTQTDHKTLLFTQDMFRELLYESFKPEQRTRTHAQVAETLERAIGKGLLKEAPIERVTAIADHYMVGCVPDKIVRFAIEAGRRSANLFAASEAERYLLTALTILKADNSPRYQKPKLQALRLLADTRRLAGQIEGARDMYLEAIPLAQQLGAPVFTARMLTSLADVYLSLDNMKEALVCCERSLELSLSGDDKASAARCYLTSCVIQFLMGNLAGSIQHTESALALAREVEDRGSTGEALAFLGHLYVAAVPEKAQAGITLLTEAVGILTELGNKVGLQNAYNLLGAAQYKQGDFTEAAASFGENQKICFELGLKEEEAYALLNQAITAFELGEFARGLKATEDAERLGVELGSPMVPALALAFKSAGKAYAGRLNEAHKLAQQALGLFKQSPNKFLEARVLEHRVALLLYMGRLAEAKDTAERLLTLLTETGNTEPESHIHAMLAEILGRLGDLPGAEACNDKALSAALASESKGVQVHALKTKAWLALQREEYPVAQQLGREALLLSYRIGTRYFTAELHGMQGEIDLATGTGDAAGHFKAMGTLADQTGAPLLQALALFGQAASAPYDEGTSKLASRAQQLVHTLMVGLDPEALEGFKCFAERARVLKGDYIDFSLKRTRKAVTGPMSPGLGFGQGMW